MPCCIVITVVASDHCIMYLKVEIVLLKILNRSYQNCSCVRNC